MNMKSPLLPFFIALPFLAFSQIDHWETAVYAENEWRYRLGTSEPPSTWSLIAFDDSSWEEGEGSIGYGDGDDNTQIPPTESLYMRRKFTVTDKSKIESALFHADYDDGFVAYLNGFEIARANLEGTPPAHDTWPPEYREALMYGGGLPEAFYLDAAQIQALLNDGDNVLAIQTHNHEGLVSSDMTTLYWLSFGINDESNDYGPVPSWFMNFDFETPLPIVTINTWGEPIPDEPSIQAEMGIIWNSDGTWNSGLQSPNEFLGNISIERRGQSSQFFFPKVGYAIETKNENWEDMDVEFLNFPEEEDWVLHGPYSDKTLIRNVLAMHLARSMGQYASRTRLVELVINEQYEGVYVLMERIKRDDNRVDIAKLNPEDISGDELTGGYVFKLDKGPADWYSQYDMVNNPGEKLRFQYVSPKRSQIMPEQEAYIKSYVDSFENAMLNPGGLYGGKRYDEYIDLESFVDHFIHAELTKNVDAYRISTYMYKDKDSNDPLIKAGPVWDFNLAFGNADYCNSDSGHGWVYDVHCGIFNPFWWGNMFDDEAFVNTAKCRWQDFRQGPLATDSIFAFIDEKVELLAPVIDRNFERWPILDEYVWPNPVVTGSYGGEIEFMKDFIEMRVNWMDANMFGTCTATTAKEVPQPTELSVWPNPADDELNLAFQLPTSGQVTVSLVDVLGKNHLTQVFQSPAGQQNFTLKIPKDAIHSGFYFLRMEMEGQVLGIEQVILQ